MGSQQDFVQISGKNRRRAWMDDITIPEGTGSGALRTVKTKKFDIKSSFDRMKKHCPDLKRSRSIESRKIEKKILRFLQHFQKYIYLFSESENN